MIEVQNLSRRYADLVAVDALSLRMEPGQVVALLGPNGAGKTTAMRMMAGFLRPSSGSARVCGFDVWREALKAKRMMGYLPEGAPSYGELSVREFLLFIARLRGDAQGRGRQDELIARLRLEPVLERAIHTLSKGLRRRVGLAQALLHDPPVLILDEPTDGLDPNQEHQVCALIDDMAHQRTILMSTHWLEEVQALCTRVLIMACGRLLADASPAELQAQSRYHGAVSFSAPGAGVARAMLERLPDVAAVEVDPLDGRITVFPRQQAPILPSVQALLAAQGVQPSELQLERGRLDEVFRDITRQAQERL